MREISIRSEYALQTTLVLSKAILLLKSNKSKLVLKSKTNKFHYR